MANVLGELFSDIANAIREKTGETGTMKPAQFPEKISAIEVGSSNKNVILEKTTVESFALNSSFGLYMHQVSPPPFTLTVDETYTVLWDDVEYEVEALDVGFVMAGTVAMGNGTVFGIGTRDDVPFIIAQNDQCVYYIAVEDYDQPHTVCIYLKVSNEPVIVDGVDPYYQQLAEALMKRDAQYLSGDSRTMSMSGFVVSDGTTLASLQPYSFAGFKNVEGMEFSDVVLVQDNAFVGNSKMKILDITTADSTTFTNFFQNALDGCTSLEAVIIRGGASGLTTANINSVQKANDTFYIYVPAACYDAVISNITDGFLPASRYRRLEEYPAIDNWNKTFTVEFYDGDTLLTSQSVAYGAVPSYSPSKDGYVLMGWEPEIVPATNDARYSAKWVPTFATATWQEIVDIANAGKLMECYSAGEEKELTLNYTDGTSETVTVVLANGNCSMKTTGNVSATANGVFFTKNPVVKNKYIVTSGYNKPANLYSGGVYTALTTTLLDAIPAELAAAIIPKNNSLGTKLWVPKLREFTKNVMPDYGDVSMPSIFAADVRTLYQHGTSTPLEWWVNDYTTSGGFYFYTYVSTDGTSIKPSAQDKSCNIAFAFCI